MQYNSKFCTLGLAIENEIRNWLLNHNYELPIVLWVDDETTKEDGELFYKVDVGPSVEGSFKFRVTKEKKKEIFAPIDDIIENLKEFAIEPEEGEDQCIFCDAVYPSGQDCPECGDEPYHGTGWEYLPTADRWK